MQTQQTETTVTTKKLPAAMDSEHATAANRIARMVAFAYTRRSHKVDPEDALQQCWLICLEVYAAGGWDNGIQGFSTICYVACNRQMSRYLPTSQAVVSCFSKDEKGLRDLVMNDHEKCILDAREKTDDPIIVEDIRTRLRHRLFQLAGQSAWMKAASLVWLDGYAPTEAAQVCEVKVEDVYYGNTLVAGVAKNDRRFRELALELATVRGYGVKNEKRANKA